MRRVVLREAPRLDFLHEARREVGLGEVADRLRRWPPTDGIVVLDLRAELAGNDWATLSLDGLHPNKAGNAVIAKFLAKRIPAPAEKKELEVEVIQGGVTWFAFTGASGDGREDLRGTRLVVVDAAGRTIHERLSLHKTTSGVSLPPGPYRASLVRGRVTIDEEAFIVSAGESIEVKLSLH